MLTQGEEPYEETWISEDCVLQKSFHTSLNSQENSGFIFILVKSL